MARKRRKKRKIIRRAKRRKKRSVKGQIPIALLVHRYNKLGRLIKKRL